MRKFARSPAVIMIVLGMGVSLCLLGFRSLGGFEFLELIAFDRETRLRAKDSKPDPRIVLVGVTEEFYQQEWPLTDATLATALTILTEAHPRAIGLDIYRDFPIPRPAGAGHDRLNAVFSANPRIVAITLVGDQNIRSVPPPPVLAETDQVGFNDLVLDRDRMVRRGLLFMGTERETAFSFGLRLALLYLQTEGVSPQPDPVQPEHLRLGNITLAPLEADFGGYGGMDSRGYQIPLDFQGLAGPPNSYTFSDLLAGKIDPKTFSDKVVLIGMMAESTPDLLHIPIDPAPFGVHVHAHVISQLLRAGLDGQSPMRSPSEAQETGWIVLWSLLGGALGFRVRSPWKLSLLAVGGLGLLFVTFHGAFVSGWWVPLASPSLAWLVSASVVTAYMANHEKRDRSSLMDLFKRHLSPEVAEVIWQQKEKFLDGGRFLPRKLTATVLFVDLKGFTAISEKMEDPQALMDWLNTCIDALAQQVGVHNGVIDDYAGDAIKVDFGVPLARRTEAEIRQDAVNAVKCALAMEQELIRLNARLQEQQLPTIGMRIGIYTGPVVAGSLGSAQRLKYTTVGDTVNTASRLESFDKDSADPALTTGPCRILIGESTARYLDEHFDIRRVSQMSLKGKEQKITVFRVYGRKEKETHEIMQGGLSMKTVKMVVLVSLTGFLLGGLMNDGAWAEQQTTPKPPRAETPSPTTPNATSSSSNKQQVTASLPVYQPPRAIGQPGGRKGGGTRGTDQSFTMSVLAPNHLGLTAQDQPILYWFLSKSISKPIEFTLVDDRTNKTILETTIKPPFNPGVQRIRLADYGVRLGPGKYEWNVALVLDPEHRSQDIAAAGWIEVAQTPKLPPNGKPDYQFLAGEGLWYDAVASISDLIDASPNDSTLRIHRASLLKQVGLVDVAEFDLQAAAAR